MKILHTADLHLKEKEHISIVESIIQVANREGVDIIIIAGDLFDTAANGRVLESSLLSVWENFTGDILVVPGNHDDKYLSNRSQLASNVIIANQIPYSIAKIEDVYFVCVPYQKNISLADIEIPTFSSSVLITHGTYNTDKENMYFPIHPNDVAGRYDYVALGHYHTWFDKWEEGTLIVNPGAPRQTRKTDRGGRYVSIVNTDTWMMERIVLPVLFTEYKTINISVSDSEDEIVQKILHASRPLMENKFCRIELTIQGSIMFTDYSLSEVLEFWKQYLTSQGVDTTRIVLNTDQIIQVSSKLIYSAFTRLIVDKIAADNPEQVSELAPFLFERLQQGNQNIL